MKKKIVLVLVSGLLVVSLVGCNKKDSESTVEIKLPIQSTSTITEESITTESLSTETNSTEEIVEPEKQSYVAILEEKKALEDFVNQLKYLEENHLLKLYKEWKLGAKQDEIVQSLSAQKYKFINNVTLNYLYDDSNSLINMEKRKGLIVFTESNLSLKEETERLSTLENYEGARNHDIIVDVTESDFDSFVVFVFNESGLLIGKFKYLLTQEMGKQVDYEKLSGSLTFDENINLSIDESSDVVDIVEKMDTIRDVIEQYEVNINSLYAETFESFKNIYDTITNESTETAIIKSVKEKGLGIEQMPKTAFKKYNDKYLKDFDKGYYVFMSINEDKTSPDLRYDNEFLTLIFDENDNVYYAEITSKTYSDIKCEDEKNADDYTLKELYKLISTYQDSLSNYSKEKEQFNDYLDKNLGLLNSRISYEMTKEAIIAEIDLSGLKYDTNYQSAILTTGKDKNGTAIELVDKYGDKIYDECIKVTSNLRTVFYFFKDSELVAIHKTDYIDMSEGKAIEDYYSLKVIHKGLEQLEEKESKVLEERQVYVNMVNKKISDFMKLVGYSANHTKNQIYKKNDILKALASNGILYEEGMNKGDGLYYIGIFTLDTDTKYTHKIYFNAKYEVELIQ